MSSTPGDYNQVVCVGTVERILPRETTQAFLLRVHDGAGPPCFLVVWPPVGSDQAVRPGQRVWAKGTLRVEDVPGRRALHYLQCQFLEVMSGPQRVAV